MERVGVRDWDVIELSAYNRFAARYVCGKAHDTNVSASTTANVVIPASSKNAVVSTPRINDLPACRAKNELTRLGAIRCSGRLSNDYLGQV